jgi:hypothetical protein
MGVYDPELVYSWEPWEYKAMRKGAAHRQVDDIDMHKNAAMFNRKAQNDKRVSAKQLFDSEKEHQKIERELGNKPKRIVNLEKHRKMKQDLKEYVKQLG